MTDRGLHRLTKHWGAHALVVVVALAMAALLYIGASMSSSVSYAGGAASSTAQEPQIPPLNVAEYNQRSLALAHVATSSPWYYAFLQGTTTAVLLPGATTTIAVAPKLWPVRAVYPRDSRALLPFNRIVAYYGNFYSTGMGVLGEYDEATVLSKLQSTVAQWQAADPTTPVIPAIEYIDVTAQGSAGKDGKYRARMPDDQIDKALEMAHKVNGIVVLDIQLGFSTVQDEVPLLEKYLAMPDVHLALDPEFAMKHQYPPGREIGTMDASEINWTANYLANIVRTNNLPPKILLIHRFTEDMITNYQKIKPLPEVQMVVQMDGWGGPARKKNTYNTVVAPEPVQFTGLKLFYKNDLKEDPPRLLTFEEIFNLNPVPIYIQYQ